MSRQREWQQRMRFEGRCTLCGDEAADSNRKNCPTGKSAYCVPCRTKVRERNRDKYGRKRRNIHSESYKEEYGKG